MSYVFFFQAEDGIRDADVTRVQTCALPIWTRPKSSRYAKNAWSPRAAWADIASIAAASWCRSARYATPMSASWWGRSEERRVGKECRARWWPYREKEQVCKTRWCEHLLVEQ